MNKRLSDVRVSQLASIIPQDLTAHEQLELLYALQELRARRADAKVMRDFIRNYQNPSPSAAAELLANLKCKE